MRIRMEAGREGKKESERERVYVCVREEGLFARSRVEVCAFIRTRTYICTRTYVCRMPEHVRMYVCVCVCAVCTCRNGTSPLAIYTQTHRQTHTRTHTNVRKLPCICTKPAATSGSFAGIEGFSPEIQGFFSENRALQTGLFCGKTRIFCGNIGLGSFQVYCKNFFAGIFWGIQGSFANVHGSFP